MKHYHYIFTGSGLSALMTLYNMVLSGRYDDTSILLLDEDTKNNNDRTWCFWDQNDLFPDIIAKKWNYGLFANANYKKNLHFEPYEYKMIRGADFYKKIFGLITQRDNIHFINEKVLHFKEADTHCLVTTAAGTYTCDKIFNSIYNPETVKAQSQYPLLQQHFIGWFIKTKEPAFNPDQATFMDFSVEQKGNTRFMYVLPTSPTEALLEYTLFSKDLLPESEYKSAIQKYIKQLGITDFEIIEKEKGNIPMTSYKFWKQNTKNIIHIGSAGGWTKASTGYTFRNATKKAKALVHFLSVENDFRKFHKRDKFWFYDLLFLDVLYRRNDLGSTVFGALFKSGNPKLIFKFLDEETSYWEDLQVILKCPKSLFIKALWKRVF
jgi:lycopene beta-cyclase